MNAYVAMTKLEGHWRRVSEHRLKAFGPKEWNKVHGSLQEIGFVFQREVKARIQHRDYAPNHPFTKIMKIVSKRKGGVPLIDTATMVNAIRNHKMGTYKDPVLFVGIPRTESRSGAPYGSLYSLAYLMHEGFTIRVTEKMRAYLHANGLHLKAETKELHVPPRPYIKAVATDKKFVAEVNLHFKTTMTDIWFTR